MDKHWQRRNLGLQCCSHLSWSWNPGTRFQARILSRTVVMLASLDCAAPHGQGGVVRFGDQPSIYFLLYYSICIPQGNWFKWEDHPTWRRFMSSSRASNKPAFPNILYWSFQISVLGTASFSVGILLIIRLCCHQVGGAAFILSSWLWRIFLLFEGEFSIL